MGTGTDGSGSRTGLTRRRLGMWASAVGAWVLAWVPGRRAEAGAEQAPRAEPARRPRSAPEPAPRKDPRWLGHW